MPYHPRVDIEHWLNVYSWFASGFSDHGGDCVPASISPLQLAYNESLRRRLLEKYPGLRRYAKPTDVFIWNVRPTPEPFLTRVGGVPYRPRSLPWPHTAKGTPFSFLAQYCFLDSKDLFPFDLPGDVLLVFWVNKPGARWFHCDPRYFHFEWHRVPIASPVCNRTSLSRASFRPPELYGSIFRSFDVPQRVAYRELKAENRRNLFTYHATKIGGAQRIIQNPFVKKGETFLCDLNSISPSSAWPFIDVEKIEDYDATTITCLYSTPRFGGPHLDISDGGIVHFVLTKDRSVRVNVESH